jgi:TRAP-type C4-dicarboxylate transport system permease large subunit
MAMGAIVRGVLPFITADLLRVLLIAGVPALSLWLPNLLFKSTAG